MAEKIEPCPHCAGTDIRFDRHAESRSPTGEVWSMCCYGCGATFPNRYKKHLLVEVWNRRAAVDGRQIIPADVIGVFWAHDGLKFRTRDGWRLPTDDEREGMRNGG